MSIIEKRGQHNSLTSYNPLNHLNIPKINSIQKLPDSVRDLPIDEISDINPTLFEEAKATARNWKLNDLLDKLQATREKLQTSQVVEVDDLINLLTETQKELIVFAASSRKV